MRKLLMAAAAAIVAAPVAAQPVSQPPKLVVAISVDQLSSDLWDEYRPHFRGGFSRLVGGTVFRNGYQSHAATETCPGHSTLLTAKRPATNGIIANSWLDQKTAREDKVVYCAENESVTGSTSTAYTVSPAHLNAQTLGDRLKTVSPASRNVAVSGKDRAAVMMGGRNVDQRWYWDGKTFSTDLQGAAVPKSVIAFKTALANALAASQPPLDAPALCQAKSRAYQLTPTLKVGDNRFGRAAGDIRQFRASPEFDGATLALAAALAHEMDLGRGQATDILSISLSATDYVGHSYGGGGTEMCLQLLALDREIGDFFAQLDRSGIDYAVMLTADHGGMDIPERLREQGVNAAARADAGLEASEIGKLLAPRFNSTASVLKGIGIGGDIWVDAAVPEAQKAAVVQAAKEVYAGRGQVFGVYTRDEIMATPMPSGSPDRWSIVERVRASYDPSRSGDLYVVLKEHISPNAVPSQGYVATHGTPWDYDRRVPILFWRRGMAGSERPEAIETVDIMPTLAAAIGLSVDQNSIDGKCLAGISGINCPAR